MTTYCAKSLGISAWWRGFETPHRARAWLAAIVANGRFANGAPGTGALKVGEAADILVLASAGSIATRSCRRAVDLVFARANRRMSRIDRGGAAKWCTTDA